MICHYVPIDYNRYHYKIPAHKNHVFRQEQDYPDPGKHCTPFSKPPIISYSLAKHSIAYFTQFPPTRCAISQILDLSSVPSVKSSRESYLAILQHQFSSFSPLPLRLFISIHQYLETLKFSPDPRCRRRCNTLNFL